MSMGTNTLMQASNQWSTRPADERFSSLGDLHAAVSHYRAIAKEVAGVEIAGLRTENHEGEVVLIGRKNVPAKLTHWSFGQLCQRVGAPASYLRDLPATLAVQNLNHGLKEKEGMDASSNLLLAFNGGSTVRAFTSRAYTRIWNSDVTSRLIRLTDMNPAWQPAPAAFDGSRGLYASDHDMFAFLVDNDRRIFEKAVEGGLSRGFFVWNSEVGAKSFGVMSFLYEYVCGNHIVWGASGVKELRLRHVGNADDRAFGELECELKQYADSSAAEDESKIESAMKFHLGKDKDEVLDKVFGLRIGNLSRKLITDGYERAEEHESWYGDPRTVWGIVNGITEVARDLEFADKRVEVEQAAGKLMECAF